MFPDESHALRRLLQAETENFSFNAHQQLLVVYNPRFNRYYLRLLSTFAVIGQHYKKVLSMNKRIIELVIIPVATAVKDSTRVIPFKPSQLPTFRHRKAFRNLFHRQRFIGRKIMGSFTASVDIAPGFPLGLVMRIRHWWISLTDKMFDVLFHSKIPRIASANCQKLASKIPQFARDRRLLEWNGTNFQSLYVVST